MSGGEDRSVLTRPAPGPALTVRYDDHPDGVADVVLPATDLGAAAAGPVPLVLLWHGGFWLQDYDRRHLYPLAHRLAHEGFAVALPEFRRVGGSGGWPETFDDVRRAAHVVPGLVAAALAQPSRSPGASLDGRVVLAGHSAGGHLALWSATSAPPDGLVGALALAPVADLVTAAALGIGEAAVVALLGATPHEGAGRYAATDPVQLPAPASPVVVLHGSDDAVVPVVLSRAYAAAHAGPGDDVVLEELAGAGHFGLIDPQHPDCDAVVDALHALLA